MYNVVSSKLGIKVPENQQLPKSKRGKFDVKKFIKAAKKAKKVFEEEEKLVHENERLKLLSTL